MYPHNLDHSGGGGGYHPHPHHPVGPSVPHHNPAGHYGAGGGGGGFGQYTPALPHPSYGHSGHPPPSSSSSSAPPNPYAYPLGSSPFFFPSTPSQSSPSPSSSSPAPHRPLAPPLASPPGMTSPNNLQAMVDAATLTQSGSGKQGPAVPGAGPAPVAGPAGKARGRPKGSKAKSKEKEPGEGEDVKPPLTTSSSSPSPSPSSFPSSTSPSSSAKKPRGRPPRKATPEKTSTPPPRPREDEEDGESNSENSASSSSSSSESDSEDSGEGALGPNAPAALAAGEALSAALAAGTSAPVSAFALVPQPSSGAHPPPLPPLPMTKAALVEAFNALYDEAMNPNLTTTKGGLPASTQRQFITGRRRLFKRQLGYIVSNPEVLLTLLLHRARVLYKAFDKEEDKVERDLLISLFGGVLGKGLTQRMLGVAGWSVGRVFNCTKEGEEIIPYIHDMKRRIKSGKSVDSSSGSPATPTPHVVGVPASSDVPKELVRQRNRICKSTGRTMHEEREIALKYFNLPQFANADIMTIYLQYAFDTTGGDPKKHPPLSRAHFYSVAPEEKRRKRKPEIHKVDCSHCKKSVRIRIEEVEEQGPPIKVKKKKVKKVKKKKGKAATAEGGTATGEEKIEGQEGAQEGKTEAKVEEENKGEGKEEKKGDGEEAKEGEGKEGEGKEGEGKEEEAEFLPGPMVKRIKVEVIAPVIEEVVPPPKKERKKRKRPGEPEPPPVEVVKKTPKKRGRPKKARPTLTITPEMLPLLNKPQTETAEGEVGSSAPTDQQGDVSMSAESQAEVKEEESGEGELASGGQGASPPPS